jgi:hypothetical protein
MALCWGFEGWIKLLTEVDVTDVNKLEHAAGFRTAAAVMTSGIDPGG